MDAKESKKAKVVAQHKDPQEPKQPADAKTYKAAIQKGKAILADGGSKADAARAINELLVSEEREVILRAFIEGATITEKGAPTYFYNIQRKARRKNTTKQSKECAD